MSTNRQGDLSPLLKQLVSQSVAILGKVIEHELGAQAFARTERIRHRMAGLRQQTPRARHSALVRLNTEIQAYSPSIKRELAHSFTLMLELMNACENAYRTFRLHQKLPSEVPKPSNRESRTGTNSIVYVLTAHPSEARSPENISVFHSIQQVLTQTLRGRFETHGERLRFLLEMAWHTPTSPHSRPSVEDEAEHLYSILLRPSNIETLLEASQELSPIHIRSWVGGDKDGNPFVDEEMLTKSLQLSRNHLIRIIEQDFSDSVGIEFRITSAKSKAPFRMALGTLRQLRKGDGARVKKAQQILARLIQDQRKRYGAPDPQILRAEQIFRLFPALVVPLELREGAELIHSSGGATGGSVISRMLIRLREISSGGDPLWYARGLIISMASSAADVRAGIELVSRTLRSSHFPVIPLFEQLDALENGPAIVQELFQDRALLNRIRTEWSAHFEVMLGYSDSAKQIGSLKSRVLIARAVRKLDMIIRQHRCTPVFFHGSGGSVDRGGGSIDEQTAWWPKSALSTFKATIQGEMVERTFASPEITRSQFERITKRAEQVPAESQRGTLHVADKRAVLDFAERSSEAYRARIADRDFTLVTRKATLYGYLDALRIGSRPTKRGKSVENAATALRAIPWVLCWTQTRTLFPSWWGVGSAWRDADAKQRKLLRNVFGGDPLFRSYVKLLGFTLAKVELPVWRIYLEASGLPPRLVREMIDTFEREYDDACRFVRTMSRNRNLLWFRPWLATSIRLRSPMIHPLNLLQIAAMAEHDPILLRITVTGISSGMMTTG